jgi:hypothetical protein
LYAVKVKIQNISYVAHAGADMNMPPARIPMSNVQKTAHAGVDMNMPTARIPMSNVQKAAHAGADSCMLLKLKYKIAVMFLTQTSIYIYMCAVIKCMRSCPIVLFFSCIHILYITDINRSCYC